MKNLFFCLAMSTTLIATVNNAFSSLPAKFDTSNLSLAHEKLLKRTITVLKSVENSLSEPVRSVLADLCDVQSEVLEHDAIRHTAPIYRDIRTLKERLQILEEDNACVASGVSQDAAAIAIASVTQAIGFLQSLVGAPYKRVLVQPAQPVQPVQPVQPAQPAQGWGSGWCSVQ
jgi:hypothetical protein